MLERLIKVPGLVKSKLSTDTEIIKLLNKGRSTPLDDISEQIRYNDILDMSELNEINGAHAFISINLNTIVDQGTSTSAALRVSVAASKSLPMIDGVTVPLKILERVVKIIEGSKFDLPQKPTFQTADEIDFDDRRTIGGYMLMFLLVDGDQDGNEF